MKQTKQKYENKTNTTRYSVGNISYFYLMLLQVENDSLVKSRSNVKLMKYLQH